MVMKINREEKYECTLSDELLERAKKELNEDPERRANDIEALRQWLLKQRHINGRTDDAFLLRFLRNAKFSIERAKEKIDKFYTMKTALPEWFSGMDVMDPLILDIIKFGTFVPIGYDKDGRRVIIGRVGHLDSSKYKMDLISKAYHLIAEYIAMDEKTQICGTVFIYDLEGLGVGHAAQATPTFVKKFITCMQDATPIRLKGIHYYHTPAVFDVLFPLAKSFMKSKLLQRLHVHGYRLESLHAEFSPEILPTEYGGTAGDLSKFIDEIETTLLELREYFIEEERYKVDESKRPGKPKTPEDLFGVDGTFRKLAID